ncbi:MAG: DEAD/DEAH box helicase family protein [Cetobacterium sp.]|uniref:DEAD/DEAH box helicase family protein n=1 Tax=Cetobacterium sp. TaxID=2071632 RepID=UPI003EE59F6C
MIKDIFKHKYINFEEFEKKIELIESNNEKGEIFEIFVYFYLLYKKDYYKIKELYREKEIPVEIKQKIKLENTDHGVDGIIIKEDNTIVAYQAKFRSRRISPTETELSTFWSESEYADERLIIANSSSLPKVTNKKKNQIVILIDSFLSLKEDFFQALSDFINTDFSKVKKIEKKTPRSYQEKIIKDILTGFENSDRGKVIAACGVGKTLISLWTQENLKANTILYMVPSLLLVKQTLESWIENCNQKFDYLCICSDETIDQNILEDEIYLSASDLDFKVTTNPQKIEEFLKKDTKHKKVIFSTYHSLDAVTNSVQNIDSFKFDLGIFDESHRTAGTKDSKMFVYGLKDEFISIKKRLFMTATERIVSSKIKNNIDIAEEIIFSMDNEELYGEEFSNLTFGEAIEKNIINDYKIVVCAFDEEEYENIFKENKYIKTELGDKEVSTDIRTLISQLILTKAIEQLEIKKIISYHSSVEGAKKFIEGNSMILPLERILNNSLKSSYENNIFTGHVNGKMSNSKRKEILASFEDKEISILSNAKCLTEGVDLPSIDAVYFVDPKNSVVDIVQAVGRALRKSKFQTLNESYVILPIVIPKDDIESSKNFDQYEILYNVLKALKDQDHRLKDEIEEINYQISTKGSFRANRSKNSRILIMPYSKVNIDILEEKIFLKVAEIGKKSSKNNIKFVEVENEKKRKSSVKRKFVSIGDYSIEALKTSITLPTLKKFNNLDEGIKKDKIVINNNNVSQSLRLGIIKKENELFYLTNIGKKIFKNNEEYLEVIKYQLLKYYKYEKQEEFLICPYRILLKVLLEVDFLTKFEFLYTVYSIKSEEDAIVSKIIEKIFYLRETYSNLEMMSEENKKKILKILNDKYDVDFSFLDIWTTKTTTTNQYSYFRNHLNIFEIDNKVKIEITEDKKKMIKEILDQTKFVDELLEEKKEKELLERYLQF